MENCEITKEDIEKQRENNSMFINITALDENMINTFYKFYNHRVKRFDFYSFIICGILFIVIAINSLIKGSDYFLGIIWNIIINIIFIGIGLGFLSLAFKSQKYDKKSIVKIYAEDISNVVNNFFFDDEKMLVINRLGETQRVYEYLDSVYEAKNYYYFFTTKKNAFIMQKNAFTKGTEKEFHKFIKQKMGRNYKKRCIRK